jgi:hypothetical protein
MLAFIDLFWLVALSYLALIPLIFIAQPKPRAWFGRAAPKARYAS